MLLQLPPVVRSLEPGHWQECLISTCMLSFILMHNGVNQPHVGTSLQGFPGQCQLQQASLNFSSWY